jgi:adenosylcobinamide-phosphate synthase
VAEAAFAAALGVQLRGLNRYRERIEVRPTLGDGRPVEVPAIDAAVALSRVCTVVLAGALAAVGLAASARRRARRRSRRTR